MPKLATVGTTKSSRSLRQRAGNPRPAPPSNTDTNSTSEKHDLLACIRPVPNGNRASPQKVAKKMPPNCTTPKTEISKNSARCVWPTATTTPSSPSDSTSDSVSRISVLEEGA